MDRKRRELLIGSGALLLAGALPAFGDEAVAIGGRAFGTHWRLTLPAAPADPQALGADLARILERIDLAASPFRPDSEIARFNRSTATGRIAAGPDVSAIAAEALRVAGLTGGAFDPSVGPDVGRFGFGPITGTRAGGYEGLAAGPGEVGKSDPALSFDFCGIAKGYALDLMAARLEARGHPDFLIDLGGEVLARGRASGGRDWRVGIADPVAGGVHARLDAKGLALATSGDAVNAYVVAGRRYSHVIDPETGEPVRNRVASVSVLSLSAMTADALATGLMVMGPDKGLAFAEAAGLPVLYLLRGEDGLEARASAGLAAHSL